MNDSSEQNQTPIQRTKRPLYREIASMLAAIRNCERQEESEDADTAANGREWKDKHEATLKRLVDMLPSGSGIDCGTKIEAADCRPGKLVFYFSYHHMNDVGMYDGWTEHKLIVTPSFDGIDLRITGPDRNQVKEYLYETYHYALTQEVEIS